jgi:hypothetical protein
MFSQKTKKYMNQKIERFLICKNPNIDGQTYVLCTRPVCLFRIPDMELIFGQPDEKLKDSAKDWYFSTQNHQGNGE